MTNMTKELLTDEEREYLKNVIKPIRKRIMWIRKWKHYVTRYTEVETISIYYWIKGFYGRSKMCSDITIHRWKRGEEFKGLELEHKYSVEELGL